MLLAAHSRRPQLNEIKAAKLPSVCQVAAAPAKPRSTQRRGRSAGLSLGPVGLIPPGHVIVDRTVAAMSDFVCGANEDGLPPTPASTAAAICREPAWLPTSATSSPATRVPTARARSRSCRGIEVGHIFQLAHQVFRGDEGDLPRRDGQAAADGHGLLRHRRHAHRGGRDRAEPRRARHHLAGADRAVRRVAIVPDRHAQERGGARSRRQALHASSPPPASKCCSTTATSARASCSPTWN